MLWKCKKKNRRAKKSGSYGVKQKENKKKSQMREENGKTQI